MVAVRIFQIIGIVVIILVVLVSVVLLPFLSRLLKKLNKSLSAERTAIVKEMRTSLGELNAAQNQIEAVTVATDSIKSGLKAAISATDKAVGWLESSVFQVGLPILLSLLIITASIVRGIKPRKGKKAVTVVPPPSWESGPE